MFSSYKQINVIKNDIKIGYIQSISISHIKKNDYLDLPFPINFFGEGMAKLEDRWKRIIEAECSLFVISLKSLNDVDKFSLLENCGIDFRFGIELLIGECSYNEEGYMTHVGDLKSIWKEEDFRFQKPECDYDHVNDIIYRLERVNIIKDFSEPVDLLK